MPINLSRERLFLSFFFFFEWTILKVFTEFVTILLLLLMFWLFDHEAYGIVAPPPEFEPAPPLLEGRVLTFGPPGNSLWGTTTSYFSFFGMTMLTF